MRGFQRIGMLRSPPLRRFFSQVISQPQNALVARSLQDGFPACRAMKTGSTEQVIGSSALHRSSAAHTRSHRNGTMRGFGRSAVQQSEKPSSSSSPSSPTVTPRPQEDAPHPMMYTPLAVDYVPLTEKQIAEALWNYAAHGYQTGIGPAFAPLHNAIADKAGVLLREIYEPSVLDIGSVNGQPGLTIAEAAEEGTEVFVTDFATLGREELLRTLNKTEKGRDIMFLKADADDLQFDADAFDLVTCSMVLAACDHEAVVWDIFRVLKPVSAVSGTDVLYATTFYAMPGKAGSLLPSLEEEGFVNITCEEFSFAMHFEASEEEVWGRFKEHLLPMIKYLRSQRMGEEEDTGLIEDEAKSAFFEALRKQGSSEKEWFQQNVARVYTAHKEAESFWDFLKIPVPVVPKTR